MWTGVFWAVVLIGGILLYASGAAWREFEKKFIKPLQAEIGTQKVRRADLVRDRDQAQWEARLFDRDLHTELNEAVATVRASHKEMKPLKEFKSELHDDQEQVMDRLSDWYDDAKPGFFQKSKNIPRSSILGSVGLAPTLNQRDALKSQRDSISEQIVGVKSDIDHIYTTKLKPAKEARDDAWRGLERLKEMRRDGVMQQHCSERAAEFQDQIAACDVRIADLRALIASETARFETEQEAAKMAQKAAAKEARRAKK